MKRTSPPIRWNSCSWNSFPPLSLVLALGILLLLLVGPASLQADDEGSVSRQAFVEELRLAQASPNPFNANTTIEYTLLQDAKVRVDVYDLRGRHMETLIDENQYAGENFAVWKTETAPSGTYFFCLAVDGYQVFGKMSLVK